MAIVRKLTFCFPSFDDQEWFLFRNDIGHTDGDTCSLARHLPVSDLDRLRLAVSVLHIDMVELPSALERDSDSDADGDAHRWEDRAQTWLVVASK